VSADAAQVTFNTVDIDGMRVHYAEAGSGPAVVMLHGFPEFWYAWREQLPVLSAAGFRAIAPDLRGYNLSSKPRGLASYRVVAIVDEVVRFIEHVAPGERVILVGHDWGALIAWDLAMRRPDLLAGLAILAVPHPAVFRIVMRRPREAAKFWYQLFFQIPILPEVMLRARHFSRMKRMLKGLSMRRSAMTREVLETYEESWAQPGALWAMLAYYRALWRRKRDAPRGAAKIVQVPTLLMYGDRDTLFAHDLYEISGKWIPDLRVVRIAGGGHFVQHDNPEDVNRALLEFVEGVSWRTD
jgi:pimeloyl-ACP methyl ester carboxylesterase